MAKDFKRHRNRQQVHKKVFNISSHQENRNQNQNGKYDRHNGRNLGKPAIKALTFVFAVEGLGRASGDGAGKALVLTRLLQNRDDKEQCRKNQNYTNKNIHLYILPSERRRRIMFFDGNTRCFYSSLTILPHFFKKCKCYFRFFPKYF